MFSTKFILVTLLGITTLVQGIAIGKGTNEPETTVDPNNGIVVQSGYEGYLVSPQKTTSWLSASKLSLIKSILLPASKLLLVYGVKILSVTVHLLLALGLGFLATTAVCTFTPLCTFSIAGPGLAGIFKGESVKEQVAELARTYMTPENLEIATKFVQSALDKYKPIPETTSE